ncbi:NOA1 (predicted) [Pycnogonum litorale]
MNKSALLTYCRWRKVFEFTPRNVTKCSTKASAIETLCPEESEVKRDADDVPILSMLGNGLDYDSARLYNHRVKSFYKNKLSLKLADDVPDLIRKLPASVKLLINQDDPELKSRYPEIFNYRTEAVEDCEESCDSGTPEELSYPFSHRHATTDSEIHDTFKKDVRDLMNDPKNSRMMQDYIASYMKILDAEDNDPKYYSFPDPTVPVRNVPCSGCGAHLHCKDEAFPGYVPSKRFLSLNTNQLRSETCHRCFFLKYYNMALNVNIAAEEYPTVISEIKNKNGLVMLMIDLMDFPCSIWPGIIDIIGKEHPICVVGNKVDLLPKDSPSYLDRVKSTLIQSLKDYGVDHGDNVKYVGLISAKSGYGIESLITKLKMAWKCKGDVYLIGCTNVGKSSLFNVLLQSDLCKRQACDIVPAATTSVWPGDP